MSDKVVIIRKELSKRSIELPEITESYTKNDFYAEASEKLQMGTDQMTTFMWDNYHPGSIWYVIAGIGMLTVIGLLIYNSVISRNNKAKITA